LICPEHARRAFARATGKTPLQYLADLRVEEAKQLLARGGLSVKEVAQRVGVPDPFYFSRLFRKTAGLSPQRYCERLRLSSTARAAAWRFLDQRLELLSLRLHIQIDILIDPFEDVGRARMRQRGLERRIEFLALLADGVKPGAHALIKFRIAARRLDGIELLQALLALAVENHVTGLDELEVPAPPD